MAEQLPIQRLAAAAARSHSASQEHHTTVENTGYGRRSRPLLLIGSMITVSLGGSLLAGLEVL
jgi:hypothetical protein